MLTAINAIAAQQANSTKNTMLKVTKLLNYCATHPEATVQYKASNMILWCDSNASYLMAPKARSCGAGYLYLSNRPKPSDTDSGQGMPTMNGAIHVMCTTMREVMSSASEAKLGSLFHNGKEVYLLRLALKEVGHAQPPTPIQTDNSTAVGIANNAIKQHCSKAMDMRFYWVCNRVQQGQFHIYWKPGKYNKADYFTKHHPAAHHQAI